MHSLTQNPFLSIQVIGGGGTTNPPPGDYPVAPDSTHTVTAIPYEGYIFNNFTVVGGPQHGTHTENPITVTVPDNITVMVYVFFRSAPPPPAPAHIVLQSYEWEFVPEGVFPYTPDDVRLAWRLKYTVKNEGNEPSEYDVTLYLRNAPPYIGERIAYGHFPPLNPGDTRTYSWVVPQTRGFEYYELEIVTTATGRRDTYRIGITPAAPSPPAPSPRPPIGLLATSIFAAAVIGIAYIAGRRRK